MIGVLIFSDFQLLDAVGPISVFEVAARLARREVAVKTLAVEPGPVRSSAGIDLVARKLASPKSLRTLIVAGGAGVREAAFCAITQRYVRAVAKSGGRVASVCSGTYILAEAGLLDGRRATTHWSRTQHFRARYPDIRLEPDRIYVRDGDIWSSAGITAGIDMALAIVAVDHGDDLAQEVARHLVVSHRRSGGQSQFSTLLELKKPEGRFAELLGWARENLDRPMTVEQLADRAGMSSRHFSRAFVKETGATPSKAVERLRLDVAREQVQGSSVGIEIVARRTGFGDPERMRRAFIRAFGQPPQALRRAGRGVSRMA